jgi:hypothetical protein
MTRSHPVFVKPLFAELKAAVAGVAEPLSRAPTLALESSESPIQADTAPMRSGPCLVKWQSHDWTGPRGQCGRCGQERGYFGI